jgi:hypothetical protein
MAHADSAPVCVRTEQTLKKPPILGVKMDEGDVQAADGGTTQRFRRGVPARIIASIKMYALAATAEAGVHVKVPVAPPEQSKLTLWRQGKYHVVDHNQKDLCDRAFCVNTTVILQ